jgi:folylpolyglutamate synthase
MTLEPYLWLFYDLTLGLAGKITDIVSEELKDDNEMSASNCEHSAVFPSLPVAIKWLRDRSQQNQSVRFQVTLIMPKSSKYPI